jgi:hypothetical protein
MSSDQDHLKETDTEKRLDLKKEEMPTLPISSPLHSNVRTNDSTIHATRDHDRSRTETANARRNRGTEDITR